MQDGNDIPVFSTVFSNQSSSIRINNALLSGLPEDHLYHIALSNVQDDLKQMFGDVKVRTRAFPAHFHILLPPTSPL